MSAMALSSFSVCVLMAKNMADAWMAWSLKAARNWAASRPAYVRVASVSAGAWAPGPAVDMGPDFHERARNSPSVESRQPCRDPSLRRTFTGASRRTRRQVNPAKVEWSRVRANQSHCGPAKALALAPLAGYDRV